MLHWVVFAWCPLFVSLLTKDFVDLTALILSTFCLHWWWSRCEYDCGSIWYDYVCFFCVPHSAKGNPFLLYAAILPVVLTKGRVPFLWKSPFFISLHFHVFQILHHWTYTSLEILEHELSNTPEKLVTGSKLAACYHIWYYVEISCFFRLNSRTDNLISMQTGLKVLKMVYETLL